MTLYIILGMVVVGVAGLTWWAMYLQKIEDKHDADRRSH